MCFVASQVSHVVHIYKFVYPAPIMELPFYSEASEANLFLLVILTEPNQSKPGTHFFMDIVASVNGRVNVRLGLMFAPQSVTNF